MSINPNYGGAPNFSVVALETALEREWIEQHTSIHPLLTAIFDGKKNFNKGITMLGASLRGRLPILYDKRSHVNIDTIGLSSSELTPTQWPNYQNPELPTHAEFDVAYLQDMFTMNIRERVISKGARGDLEDSRLKVVVNNFKEQCTNMLMSDRAPTEKNLMGIYHVLSTSNTVGGISQVERSWWQAKVKTSTGTLTSAHLNNDYDELCAIRNKKPDLLLLSQNTTMNVFAKVRDMVESSWRFTVTPGAPAGVGKYGFESFWWRGAECVMDPKSRSGCYEMLTSDTWYYRGSEKPTIEAPERVPGSMTHEYLVHMFGLLACSMPSQNLLRSGISG